MDKRHHFLSREQLQITEYRQRRRDLCACGLNLHARWPQITALGSIFGICNDLDVVRRVRTAVVKASHDVLALVGPALFDVTGSLPDGEPFLVGQQERNAACFGAAPVIIELSPERRLGGRLQCHRLLGELALRCRRCRTFSVGDILRDDRRSHEDGADRNQKQIRRRMRARNESVQRLEAYARWTGPRVLPERRAGSATPMILSWVAIEGPTALRRARG
jgi:hypothetical protein